jgi:hypothetical protein
MHSLAVSEASGVGKPHNKQIKHTKVTTDVQRRRCKQTTSKEEERERAAAV